MQVPSTRTIVWTGVGVAVALVVMVWYHHRSSTAPKIPPKTQRSIDSLSITKPTFDSMQAAGRLAVVHDTVISVVYRTKVERVAVAAAKIGVVADSLAVVAARAGDSSVVWHAAYTARTREADSLMVALAASDSAWMSERRALTEMSTLYARDTLRRHATEKVNEELVTAIGKLQQPCRILPFVPCPSRLVTAAGSAAVAAVVTYRLKRS